MRLAQPTTPQVIPVLAGTVVAVPQHPASARDVRAADWDRTIAWELAVSIWLASVKSEHSRAAYRRDIGRWRAWCEANGVPLDDPHRNDADRWRDELAGAAASRARRMSAVSSFYRYWLSEGIVTRNPFAMAARPAVSKKPVSIALTRVQASDLLAYIDSLADPRPSVIFRLLAETGMRVGELTAAQAADILMSGGHHVLKIVRKGQDDGEMLPVAGTTYERVMTYLDGRTDGYILLVARTERREGDGQMDRSYVRRLLMRMAREAGLPAPVWRHMHPHVLRHSAATMLAADKVPITEIQALLGHADIRTTQRYIHHQENLDASLVYRLAGLLAK
ncbi:MAG TPA: tyrosine-type recombinase/integrase [Trebonia sp.]